MVQNRQAGSQKPAATAAGRIQHRKHFTIEDINYITFLPGRRRWRRDWVDPGSTIGGVATIVFGVHVERIAVVGVGR
jgi:hypothetical protein